MSTWSVQLSRCLQHENLSTRILIQCIVFPSILFCHSGFLATSCWVYKIWNNGWILTFKVSKRLINLPYVIRLFANGVTKSLFAKLELKILPHLAESIKSEIMDRFCRSRCLNDCIDLPNMIGSFASSATASLVAKKGTKNHLSHLFKESK